jgi:integrase
LPQHGSLRRVKRARGFAWEYRYYAIENSKRIHKTLTFGGPLFKTERALRQHLENFVLKVNDKTEYARASDVTFGALLDRYMAEEMPIRHSTRSGYTSIIKNYLRPQVIAEIRPAELHSWLQALDLALSLRDTCAA